MIRALGRDWGRPTKRRHQKCDSVSAKRSPPTPEVLIQTPLLGRRRLLLVRQLLLVLPAGGGNGCRWPQKAEWKKEAEWEKRKREKEEGGWGVGSRCSSSSNDGGEECGCVRRPLGRHGFCQCVVPVTAVDVILKREVREGEGQKRERERAYCLFSLRNDEQHDNKSRRIYRLTLACLGLSWLQWRSRHPPHI